MLVAGYLLEGWINEFNPKGIFRAQPEKLMNTCAFGNKYVIDCSNPVTALHIVRSFDPCNGCAVHVLDSSGRYKIPLVIG